MAEEVIRDVEIEITEQSHTYRQRLVAVGYSAFQITVTDS
jgi:hypothetical protein